MGATIFNLFTGQEDNRISDQAQVQADAETLLTERLWTAYRTPHDTWMQFAQDDNDFRWGVQYTAAQEAKLTARRQYPLPINVIYPAVEQGKAMLTTNTPRFSATAFENSDNKKAGIFADLMSNIWRMSNGNRVLKRVIDDFYVKSIGWMTISFDKQKDFGKGECVLGYIRPEDVYPDPNSREPLCTDAAHILIVKEVTDEQLQAKFPQIVPWLSSAITTTGKADPGSSFISHEGASPTDIPKETWSRKYLLYDRYSKILVKYYRVFDPKGTTEKVLSEMDLPKYLRQFAFEVDTQTGAPQYEVDEDEVQKLVQIYAQSGGVFHYVQDPQTQQPVMVPGEPDQRSLPQSRVELKVTTIGKLVQQGIMQIAQFERTRIKRVFTVGRVTCFIEVLPTEHYPIVPFINNHTDTVYSKSDVRIARPLQVYINKVKSLIIAHMTSSTNTKVFYPEGSMQKEKIENDWSKAGTVAIPFNGEFGQPVISTPSPYPAELFNNLKDAKDEINNIFGIYPLQQGDPGAAPQTYKGTVALEEYGQRRIRSKKDDIEDALNQIGRVVVDYIQAYYTSPKIIRLMMPNNQWRELKINEPLVDPITQEIKDIVNDVTVGDYDIIVVSGSMLPTNRWARFEYYKEMFQLGAIDREELLKQSEVVDTDGVLQRMDEMTQLKQQVIQLTQQVKALQGDLQTADREAVSARKQTAVAKFQADLEKAKSRVDAATLLHQERLNDELGSFSRDIDQHRKFAILQQQQELNAGAGTTQETINQSGEEE